LHLFRERTFLMCSLIGFIVGVALFGSVTFLPLYLQVVKGSTPSQAGMQMLPLMGGLLITSIASGRIISKIGKYRAFPIAGTLVACVAMFLLSTLKISTSIGVMYLYMGLLGAGLGMVMQVLVLAVQNGVEFQHMGVATSGVTLFRSIGGSIGVAAFGALFTQGLRTRLQEILPPGTNLPRLLGPATVHQLPAAVRDDYLQAFGDSMHSVYLIAGCFIAVAFVLACKLKNVPLRKGPA
jgi:MFS family permease